MPTLKTLDALSFDGKTALIRVDYNVPIKNGVILDDSRITKTLKTLRELLEKNAKIVILSHFGRPRGAPDSTMSMQSILPVLSEKLGLDIAFAPYPLQPKKPSARVTLLENLRFNPGEESNDPAFAEILARFGNIYVNDAFSVSHRAHASVDRITEFMPSCAGRLMEQEVRALNDGFSQAKHPIVALVAGSKISTKLSLLENLLNNVDYLVVGGGIANTFLKAQGLDMGKSLVENSMIEIAERILRDSAKKLILPVDAIVTPSLDQPGTHQCVRVDAIPHNEMIVDIGPKTVELIDTIISTSKTVVWNGPLGVFEIPPFDHGTTAVASAVAKRCNQGEIYALAGGGETVAALTKTEEGSQFSYLSTAGGAFLEWLEGRELPGVKRLIK